MVNLVSFSTCKPPSCVTYEARAVTANSFSPKGNSWVQKITRMPADISMDLEMSN